MRKGLPVFPDLEQAAGDSLLVAFDGHRQSLRLFDGALLLRYRPKIITELAPFW
jgi:hypothetical protein